MENNEKQEEVAEESTTTNKDEGVQSPAVSTLDRADQIAERQARENDRREKILDREEALAARKAVGGDIDAGSVPEKPKEISDVDYAKKALAGELNKKDGETTD